LATGSAATNSSTPGALAAKQIVLDTAMTLVLGAVVAFLYRGQGR
jgi:hypothetical protein